MTHSIPDPPGAHVHPLLAAWLTPALAGEHGSLPSIEVLECERLRIEAIDQIVRPKLRTQDASLLADGLHYEVRIAERALLATRERNAHDWFNALVWLRHARLKQALNARQVADIGRVGSKQRTRGQCALTHFDEAGAVVWVADPGLMSLWDAHDWQGLFGRQRKAWGERIAVTVFGHALVEHVWNGHALPVAKALVIEVSEAALVAQQPGRHALLRHWPIMETRLAARIENGAALADPQELRPLPLAGLPGWHEDEGNASFVRDAPCFRPLREGRRYPPPIRFP